MPGGFWYDRHGGRPCRQRRQQLALEAVEDQAHVLDRADAQKRHAAVRRPTVRLDLEPVHAAVADADAVDVQRLGDDHVVASSGRQAAVFRKPGHASESAAFFVHRAADLDRPFELDASSANSLRGIHGRGDAGFHVARAAPVDAAVADRAGKWIHGPPAPGRHDVEVAVEMHGGSERAATLQAHDIHARMGACVLRAALGGEVFDLESDARELVADQAGAVVVRVTRRVDGGHADQLDREVDDLVGGGVHRRHDAINK